MIIRSAIKKIQFQHLERKKLIPSKVFSYSTTSTLLTAIDTTTTTTTTNDNSNRANYAQFGYTKIPKSQKESLVHDVFSSVAQSYDTMNDLMSFGVHRYWKDIFVSMSNLDHISKVIRSNNINNSTDTSECFKVLDVAGGTGDIAFRFLEAGGCIERSKSSGVDPINITICDINANMLDVGKQRATQKFGSSVINQSKALDFIEGNAETLPFDDNTFDLYTIAFGLRNVTNTDKALEEAYRVLKPGGRYMCLEFSHVSDCMLLKNFYDIYSFYAIPTIGQIVANDKDSYKYLVESIRTFCTQDELAHKLRDAQFEGVKYTNMTEGIVAVHEGWKV